MLGPMGNVQIIMILIWFSFTSEFMVWFYNGCGQCPIFRFSFIAQIDLIMNLCLFLRGIVPIKWVKSNESIAISTLTCLYDLILMSKHALPSVFQSNYLDLSTSKILNCIEDSVHGLSLDDEVEIETKVVPIADKVLKPTCYIRSVISQVNRTDTGQYLGHFAVISFGSRGNFRFFNFKIVIFVRFLTTFTCFLSNVWNILKSSKVSWPFMNACLKYNIHQIRLVIIYMVLCMEFFTENKLIRIVFMVTKRSDQRNDPLTRFLVTTDKKTEEWLRKYETIRCYNDKITPISYDWIIVCKLALCHTHLLFHPF